MLCPVTTQAIYSLSPVQYTSCVPLCFVTGHSSCAARQRIINVNPQKTMARLLCVSTIPLDYRIVTPYPRLNHGGPELSFNTDFCAFPVWCGRLFLADFSGIVFRDESRTGAEAACVHGSSHAYCPIPTMGPQSPSPPINVERKKSKNFRKTNWIFFQKKLSKFSHQL